MVLRTELIQTLRTRFVKAQNFHLPQSAIRIESPAPFGALAILGRLSRGADRRCTMYIARGWKHSLELARIRQKHNIGALGRGCELVQSRYTPFEPGKPLKLRIAAYGPFVEISINGSVRISAHTMIRRTGAIGLFMEDGTARFSEMRLCALQAPAMKLPPGPISRRTISARR